MIGCRSDAEAQPRFSSIELSLLHRMPRHLIRAMKRECIFGYRAPVRLVIVLAGNIDYVESHGMALRIVHAKVIPARLTVTAILIGLPDHVTAVVVVSHFLHLSKASTLKIGGNRDSECK